MSRREAAEKALKLLRNIDDTQSIASDDDNADYLDDDNYLDEFDETDVDIDRDSHERDILFDEEDDGEEEDLHWPTSRWSFY
ncbi:unnamed protein product [Brachionus calyciflorus]|uniref:Uncharacterized protein n=1 Tax=Brachionus calyciflorus TaxID=104777 RepID=A0A814LAA2_9BILA|nr:unnamed protein product [Brachionus calyciflorus]